MHKKQIFKRVKQVIAGFMALATFSTLATDGLVLHKEQTVAQAADSGILSSKDRGIIYANSRSDFRDETIYFVITTRFYDGDPSNNARTSEDTKANNPADDPSWRGDFKGLIDKLDYIKALGFTAIWITPVVENNSGYDYHGYHAYNFDAVDTRYESNGITYQDLIDAVHAKGMKLIQDVVFNHTCNWGEENLNEIGGASLKAQVSSDIYSTRNQVVMNGTGDPLNIYHHNGFCGGGDWDNFEAQRKTIADDCFDLNTENPAVYNYLIDCYTKYINMGVDAFRVDTVKHISRLTLNSVFVPAFKAAGGENFYMFGEVCTKGHDVWYRGEPGISTCFYTWADDSTWLGKWSSTDQAANNTLVEEHYKAHSDTGSQPTSTNAFLNGNEYHTPDYSQRSGMDVIDFQMHWSFNSAGEAFSTALGEDKYFNDSTWNVVYVDSHDYGPDECQTQRYTGGTDKWAENLSLMFTFRGIPCVYYGSEIEFQAGKPIDVGPNAKLSETGRAYFGDNIEGTIKSTGFTVFENVSGAVSDTINAPLSQHIMRLNRLRQAIPALRKGQYSTEGCSGNIAFKRRYTDATTDSFALVAISGSATFSGIPNGKYVDAVTGDVQNVTGGTLTANVSGQGNMKIYVLDTAKTPAPGRVIPNGKYLTDGGAAKNIGEEHLDEIDPTSITLDKNSVSIMEATTATVKATVLPENASDKTVTWSSSDTSVATVSGGTITGVGTGTAVITAKTWNDLTAKVTVTVTKNPNIILPTGISLSEKDITLTEGDSSTLTATITPSNATNKTVTWSSSNVSVATVDGTGKVTAVKEGTAVITATTVNGYKATATVTVEGKEIPVIENGVYFEKPSSWGSNIYVYFFANDQTVGAAWPGTAMTDLGNGLYGYEYGSSAPSNLKVIFNDGSRQTANLDYVNNGYYNDSGYVKTVTPTTKGKVTVKYVDESGNVLSSQTLTGDVGSSYSTSAKTFDGYTLKTTPSNAKGTYTSSNITVTYVYAKQAVNNLSGTLKVGGSTADLTKEVGSSITLTAAGAGGTGSYTYKFAVYNSDTSQWVVLRNFSSTATYTCALNNVGTRIFAVTVKDSAGTTVATNRINVTITKKTTALSGTLKVGTSTAAQTKTVGSSITLTAAGAGGSGSYTYKWAVYNAETKQWVVLRNFSTAATYTCTLNNAGERIFAVTVKDSAGTTAATNRINVTINKSAALAGTLKVGTSTAAQTKAVGSSITLTAAGSGGSGSYTYKWAVLNASTNKWSILKDFSSTSTYIYTLNYAGVKEFAVTVKDSTGATVATNRIKVTVTAPLAGTLKAGTSTAAQTKAVGSSITLTAAGSGGSGSYTYKWAVLNASTNKWSILKDFSTTSTYTYKLDYAGVKEFAVTVKDSTGTTVATNRIKVTVTSASNELKASATVNGSTNNVIAFVGDTIKIAATATGGTGSYTYKYAVLNTDTNVWYVLKDYSSSSSYTFKLATSGNKQFVVSVKDSSGKVVSTSRISLKGF